MDMDQVLLILLWIGTAIAVLGVVLVSIAELCDIIVSLGFVSTSSKIGRAVSRRHTFRIQPVLKDVLKYAEEAFENTLQQHLEFQLKSALEAQGLYRPQLDEAYRCRAVSEANSRNQDTTAREHPDLALLHAIRPWTRKLEQSYSWRQGKHYHYIDTMGAVHASVDNRPSLAEILDAWIHLLIDKKQIPVFDFLLVPKDGNVVLAYQLATRLGPQSGTPLVVCKGKGEHSRVTSNISQVSHATDFEGLAALKTANANGAKLKPIAVDCNCTGGSTMCDAIKRFNAFVSFHHAPFDLVTDAIVLFVVQSSEAEENFKRANVKLHSLIAMDECDMESILAAQDNDIAKLARDLKKGFACSAALRLILSDESQS